MEYWQIRKRIFDVFDFEEGTVSFKGTARQVGENLGITEKTVYTYGSKMRHSDSKVKGRYKIIPTNEFVKVNGKPKKEKKVKIEDTDPTGFDYLKLMLYDRKEKKTVCSFNPVPFLPDLYDELGLNCRVFEKCDRDIKGINPYYYIVEVVNGLR